MIYSQPGSLEPVDQADLIDGVPLLEVQEFHLNDPANPIIGCAVNRVIVLTQTCDLAQRKANRITVARVLDAEELIARHGQGSGHTRTDSEFASLGAVFFACVRSIWFG